MSSSYKNPNLPLLDNPLGVDKPIQEIQVALKDGLGWLDHSFGKASRGFKKVGADSSSFKGVARDYYYPEIYQGKNYNDDYLDLVINDNFKSASFIRVEDPVEIISFPPIGQAEYQAYISIIVWFNFNRIDKTKPYRFTEELKNDTMDVLKKLSFIEVVKIFYEPQNVFNTYSIDHAKEQTFKHPFAGFRILCKIYFSEDCTPKG